MTDNADTITMSRAALDAWQDRIKTLENQDRLYRRYQFLQNALQAMANEDIPCTREKAKEILRNVNNYVR